MLVKAKWLITFIWNAIIFVIYFDRSIDFEIKKKEKEVYLLQSGIKAGPADSEFDVLTTLPSRHHKYNAGSNLSCTLNVTEKLKIKKPKRTESKPQLGAVRPE